MPIPLPGGLMGNCVDSRDPIMGLLDCLFPEGRDGEVTGEGRYDPCFAGPSETRRTTH